MLYRDFKQKTAKTNVLADVDTLGSFDFYTSIISLDSLTSRDIEQLREVIGGALNNSLDSPYSLTYAQYAIVTRTLPLIVHEYTHFLDSTSTLWGLKHLHQMDAAYKASDKLGAVESDFSSTKRFSDHCRRIRLPNYYTVIDKQNRNIRPWISQISIGHLFESSGSPSDRPILFSRFSNSENQLLARSPVSTVSLLEASAMAQELMLHIGLLAHMDTNFQMVEQRQFAGRTMDYLYNTEITEYSVCAHIVANRQGCSEALDAFRVCAWLVRTVLNYPDAAFRQVFDNCPVDDILQVRDNTPFIESIKNGLRYGDLGVLFYVLCAALPPKSYISTTATVEGIDEALRTIGVAREHLVAMYDEQATELITALTNSRFRSIADLSRAGYENLQKLGTNASLDFFDLNVPSSLLGDSSIAQIFESPSNKLRGFDLDACFDELFAGQLWVERFAEACV